VISRREALIPSPGGKIEIVDDALKRFFRLLVRDRKAMSFLPRVSRRRSAAINESDATSTHASGKRSWPFDGTPPPARSDLSIADPLTFRAAPGPLLDISMIPDLRAGTGRQILYLALEVLIGTSTPASTRLGTYAPLLLRPVDLDAAGLPPVQPDQIARRTSPRLSLQAS